jgi:diaminopropionate ammonia-lyase
MYECGYSFNQFRKKLPEWDEKLVGAFSSGDIVGLHRSLPGYRPTPTFRLPALAHVLGLGDIWVKDESYRFDLNAFKVMGASYAIYRFLKSEWKKKFDTRFDIQEFMDDGSEGKWVGRYTFCTATDGNHGRAVAWTARRLFQRAVIYMPKGTVSARIENIRAERAEVHVIDGTYDDAVRQIAEDAPKHNWQIISDTAYPGYMTIPGYIMAGYTTMFREIETAIHGDNDPGIDFVFLQAGVGSFAAAGAWYYINRYGAKRPKLISVEPTEAACLMESINTKNGGLITIGGSFETIMAGLNCGTPSHMAWPIIRDSFDLFLAIPDDYALKAMRRYYSPNGDDPHIVSGESGAAGLGALLALLKDDSLKDARKRLGFDADSRILIFNTEGATDPEHFGRVVHTTIE